MGSKGMSQRPPAAGGGPMVTHPGMVDALMARPGSGPAPAWAGRVGLSRAMARGQTVTPEMLRAAGGPASVADTASRITPAMQAILDRRAQTLVNRGVGFGGGVKPGGV